MWLPQFHSTPFASPQDACDGYAELVQLGDCDFVEVKGATFAGWDDRRVSEVMAVPQIIQVK
jgi:wyosine [tRNA(Phe)-imidazoG37] synthetase (radical SAM superfamily)